MEDKKINSDSYLDKYLYGTDPHSHTINYVSMSSKSAEEIHNQRMEFEKEKLKKAFSPSIDWVSNPFKQYTTPSKSPRKPKRKIPSHERAIRDDIRYGLKDEYTLQECLDAFNDLQNKQIGNIYLTGSVALYLQGKITRTQFKDLDIVVVGEYMLDDDIYDNPFAGKYPPDETGVERSALAFNNVKIDLFSNVHMVTFIDVEYLGKTYRCQDYKDIIKAKLRMVLPKVKDIEELFGDSFEIIYK